MSEVVNLTKELITRPSVTTDDAGCQQLIAERLQRAGFRCEHLRFGEVDNLWATHGVGTPTLVLLGHTDVVPPGPREAWASDPFVPLISHWKAFRRPSASRVASSVPTAPFAKTTVDSTASSTSRPATNVRRKPPTASISPTR